MTSWGGTGGADGGDEATGGAGGGAEWAEEDLPTRSLGPAGDCVDNPCDPSCQIYDENPPGGVPSGTAPGGTWVGGAITSIPGGFVGKGIKEPCSSAVDCQFDQHCTAPVSGTCAHSKCEVGNPLTIGCDSQPFQASQKSCVDSICQLEPGCCGTLPGAPGTCSHHPCDLGGPMAAGCDSCVDAVCAARPSCCRQRYAPPGCAHSPCSTGTPLTSGCDAGSANCVSAICASNPRCCSPTFGGSCAHSPCTLGAQLAPSCNGCVQAVCAKKPGCCSSGTTPFAASCSAGQGHDPCLIGKKLDPTCDPCIQAVCSSPAGIAAGCCTANGTSAWSQTCIDLVDELAGCYSTGRSCITSWSQKCADQVALEPAACGGQTCTPAWDATCAAAVTSSCGQNCVDGAWDASCVAQTSASCAQSCSALTGWSDSCVDKVGSVCGAECDGAVMGDCVPFQPNETFPLEDCSGVDLTLGVPCTGSLPVCNRGNATAPAGVKVYLYPGNSSHFPKCNPATTRPDVDGACTVPVAIPPGKCVTLTESNCAVWQGGGALLSGNRTAMVNPPLAGALAECYCTNNWSDYHSGGCATSTAVDYLTTTYRQIYDAVCPSGSTVQWGFLTYDATTPGDSSVLFEVHTAESAAALGPPLTAVATARATPLPDTQQCAMSGPSPCPVDLFDALDAPEGNRSVLELVLTLRPTSTANAGPTVHDWQLSYSCIDAF